MPYIPLGSKISYVRAAREDYNYMKDHPEKFTKNQILKARQDITNFQHDLREGAVHHFVRHRKTRGRGRGRRRRVTRRH
jgi:hypothetical protein